MPRTDTRLRSRDDHVTEPQKRTTRSQSSKTVLGDISNRDVGKKSKSVTTKIKCDNSRDSRSQGIHFDDSNKQNKSKPRRTSARLQVLREKENEPNHNHETETEKSKSTKRPTSGRVQKVTNNITRGRRRSSLERTKSNTVKGDAAKRKRPRSLSAQHRNKRTRASEKITPVIMDEYIREDEDQYLIHPDFRLKRISFDGKDHTLGMSKHDRVNKDDVLQTAPYVADMFQHHYALEGQTRPRLYMAEQSDINAKMRAILVDWLIEVHMKFRLVPETLYLCINIIDRYCSQVKVKREKLQLVGVTALLIACKYEEIYPPEVRDCVYITDSAYEREELLDMEQNIVHKLGFRITVPTAYPFLHRFLKLLKASPLIRHAASFYTERTLQEHDMLRYRPSLICASAVVLAINNPEIPSINDDDVPYESSNGRINMPALLLEYTGFTKLEIIECAGKIAIKVSEEPITASRRQLVAVKRKFDNKKYLNVSSDVGLPSLMNNP